MYEITKLLGKSQELGIFEVKTTVERRTAVKRCAHDRFWLISLQWLTFQVKVMHNEITKLLANLIKIKGGYPLSMIYVYV